MKLFSHLYALGLLMFFPLSHFAQEYCDQTLDTCVYLSSETPKHISDRFLKIHKAKAIEFNPQSQRYPSRLKMGKNSWVLYDLMEESPVFFKGWKKYEQMFPSRVWASTPFVPMKIKNRIHLLNLEDDLHVLKTDFEHIEFDHEKEMEALYRFYDSIRNTSFDSAYLADFARLHREGVFHKAFIGQKNGLWHRFALYDDNKKLLVQNVTGASQKEDLPPALHIPEEQITMLATMRKDYNVGDFRLQDENGFVVAGQDVKSGKWGLYIGEEVPIQMFAPEYNEFIWLERAGVVAVRKDRSWGVYSNNDLEKPEQLHDFFFADVQTFLYKSTYGTLYGYAIKYDNHWQLYKHGSSDLLIDATVDSVEELLEIYKTINQQR